MKKSQFAFVFRDTIHGFDEVSKKETNHKFYTQFHLYEGILSN